MSRNPWLIALVLSAAGSQVACTTLVCGKGTVEKDNACVSTGGLPIGGNCGPGTRLDLTSGECRPDLFPDDGGTPLYCGDNTTVVVINNVQTCVGTGGGSDCSKPIVCPAPTPGKIAVCGRIYDVQTTKPIDDGTMMGTGPASKVSVLFYEPLAFAGNPGAATTLIPPVAPDDCGRYAAVVPYQATGFIAVATDDAMGNPDDLRLTGVAAGEPAAGGTLQGLNAYVTHVATDMMWTMSANAPALGGMTFAEHGVYLPIFVDTKMPKLAPLAGTPVMGVTVTAGGAADPTRDFYFSDMDPLTRTTVGTADSTGLNGSALFINGTLMMYSGMGGEPGGCVWPSTLAATPAGVVFVSERNSQVAGGGTCM